MKVSLNWVKQFTDVDLPVDKLVEKIGAQLGAVEEVIDLGKRHEGILVVKVVSVDKHADADKLTVCLVDDGGANKKVKRNAKGLIEIVCGASNVKAGMLAAWIPPGSIVPSTFDKDPFKIEARQIRGVTSNGMLASPKELGFGDSHEGLLEFSQDDKAKPGDTLIKVLELDDYIIDIENKMFTHRPDLFGQLGVAREIAGIQHQAFSSPMMYKSAKTTGKYAGVATPLKVSNDVPKLVPRFMALVFYDVEVAPSPAWLQSYIARLGVRPINNVVDITNYFTYLTAQPLHAYDYDKLAALAGGKAELGVRLSKKGEQLKILGGKTLSLEADSIVITAGNKPIGLGGVMGGAQTEVDAKTKNIVLEVATFDMTATRRSAMTYGLFTDAAIRFMKNQSPLQNDRVMAWANDELVHQTGGEPDGEIHDLKHNLPEPKALKVSVGFINERLGLKLSTAEMVKLLKNVEFEVSATGDELKITAPFWRTDIEIAEDVVEEVGRLYGYDHLPLELPTCDLSPAALNPGLAIKDRIRDILARAGANEALTYSFVPGSLLEKVGQDPKNSYHIRNAMSPDLQYYRLSLTPNLLDKVHPNIKAGFDELALYEIGKVHGKSEIDEEELPKEFERLALVFAAKQSAKSGAPFFEARLLLTFLLEQLGSTAEYKPFDAAAFKNHKLFQQMIAPFEPTRSAYVFVADKLLGVIGEYKTSIGREFKLPVHSAGFEVFLSILRLPSQKRYQPLNRYPETEQDICLRVAADLSHGQLTDFVLAELGQLSKQHGYQHWLKPLDIFQKESDHKQITWRITLSHPERTLTTQEVNSLLDKLAAAAAKQFKAQRV